MTFTPDQVPAQGMISQLALAGARIPAQAGLIAMVEDARYQTLQKNPRAAISHLDVVYPFPSQLTNANPTPGIGDPGYYATLAQLEDS